MTEETLDTSDIPGGRFTAIAIVVCLAACLFLIPKGVKEEVDMINFFSLHPPVVSVPSSIILVISGAPTVLIMIWAIIQRIFGTLKASQINKYFKVVIINAPFFFVVPIAYKWQLSNWISDQGYERCHRLTGSTFYASKVWVRDSDYCIDNGFDVGTDLIQWAVDQAKAGAVFTPEQFYQKASLLRREGGFDDY